MAMLRKMVIREPRVGGCGPNTQPCQAHGPPTVFPPSPGGDQLWPLRMSGLFKQDSEELGQFHGSGTGKLRQVAEHNGHSSQPDADGPQGGRPQCRAGAKTGQRGPHPQFPLAFPPWRQRRGLRCVLVPGPEKQQNQVGNTRTNCTD